MGLRDKARKTLEEGDAVVGEPVEAQKTHLKAVAEPADVPAPPPKEAPAETVAKDALRHELQRARTALAAREEAWAKAEETLKGEARRLSIEIGAVRRSLADRERELDDLRGTIARERSGAREAQTGNEQRFAAVAQELNAAKGVVKAKEEEALRVERELTAAKSDLTAARQAGRSEERR